ncbi:MAG: helix-turn-helix transcriptional regulator [Rhodococcus sp. (in: high G+C Gram-positive bacteria)]
MTTSTLAPARQILSVELVAERTGLAPQTIRNWVQLGKGPRSFKLGARRVFDAADVEQWLIEQKLKSA